MHTDTQEKEATFEGRVVIIGFGSIGQGVLPLILRHLDIAPEKISVVTADERGRETALEYGVGFDITPLTKENYRAVLEPKIGTGDFLVNLSVDVSSIALMELCAERGALYIDTCIEPWPGGYTDPSLTPDKRTNYALRESALALREKLGQKSPTAVITHGANPGMVSHFVKEALLNIARDLGKEHTAPKTREEWGTLAKELGIKVIHIAERDTQVSDPRKAPGEFVNTWSIDGFVSEGSQPAELGWGTHEKHFPKDGNRHTFGRKSAIYLSRPGASTRVRTWTPLAGAQQGFLITHGESISLSDYFTVGDAENPEYRPTVHYAYYPCDDAVLSVIELEAQGFKQQERQRLISEEITAGDDALGVLLMGHAKGAYWFGSILGTEEARALIPHNGATALQVTIGVLTGMLWAIKNPTRGIVDPDEIDFDFVMRIARPYLGRVVGEYTNWTPLEHRNYPLPEDIDEEDPWQFKNFRVV